ncbi:ABC-2 type transporter, permease component [Azotobacter vinelandii CA]|uniref:ABC-2 type transporter, permease component n=2 Tax=Azotobacter vinelandii TaxID=354 RepID=C1DSD5_AZOVD|nr:ABC transporter permease [Azotobacter vinelandii]ACO77890.1 ABC-2 type transporter, permease component [Azotobacter vinelandii DJ]AGK16953.1 ABC-2 type transporter, permease component [Azotobacter vinelandii CA]AGK20054.1 ABC-2 type transporter, permease component [Azotobacter vinelandii CA6]WKN23626.1 ABC transporter permease [Azotobacter vinelandii]SFY27018.1 ABC-2 type transport system permease protein [Azotobacter vinelandii]
MRKLSNILQLGLKELRSLYRDRTMLALIVYSFSLAIYSSATGVPESPYRATVAVIDEDRSQVSARILDAFQMPYFIQPRMLQSQEQMDQGMDRGDYTFTLNIPPKFQQDLLNGRQPTIQLNVDATQVSQAFTGAGHIQQIVSTEVDAFVKRYRGEEAVPVQAVIRSEFNPNLTRAWFGSINEVVNQITMLSIILTGAALIREREHGTIEHLLVMPITPFEIMVSKVWAMGLVVLLASGLSLHFVVEGWLGVPIAGSIPLFLLGTALHLFATTSMGIFFGTVAQSMPQLGMLFILVLIPLQILSGGQTPRESMPEPVQNIMLAAPTTHFIILAQGILFRGAGLAVVWPQLLAIASIGGVFFVGALSRLRKSLR